MNGYQQSLVWMVGLVMGGSSVIAWAHAWRRVVLARIAASASHGTDRSPE